MRKSSGQIIIGAIILLVILAILVPAIIMHVQREADWTLKEQRSTRAFQLAESAVERGFQEVILSTSNWATIQGGGTITNYHFDRTYTDMSGGTYEVNIAQGPGGQTATITGVGRDTANRETRAVRAIYSNAATNAALYANGGLTLASNPSVEWGPIHSPNSIITNKLHPRFYSKSNISLDPNGASPPNTDNVQWWSYFDDMPPAPEIDTQAYLSSATAQGAATHVRPAGSYQMRNDICGGSASCSGVYYFSGNTTLTPPWAFVNGSIVVMGDLTINGAVGTGTYAATLPTNAWKDYGNDWSYYRSTYDGGAPATFPGVNGSYSHGTLTANINNVLVHGFLYSGGSVDINGGGNMSVHGTMYIGDSSSLAGSHVTVYYDDSTTVLTKNVTLIRASWNEIIGCSWATTSGAHATCP